MGLHFTESQNGWGWKGLLESILSEPLFKQDHLEQVAQDHIQLTFEKLQGWRVHNLSGYPVPVVSSSHSKKKKCFLKFRQSILCLSVPIAPHPVAVHHWKEPDSIFVSSPQTFYALMRTPPEPFLSSVQLSQLFFILEMLQSLNDLWGLSFHSVQCIHFSLILRNPELDTVLHIWLQWFHLSVATCPQFNSLSKRILRILQEKVLKAFWSPGRQYPVVSPHLAGKPFCHRRLSSGSSMTFPLGKPCWAALKIFLFLHVPGTGFHYYLLHHFLRDWGEANSLGSSLLEDRSDIYIS